MSLESWKEGKKKTGLKKTLEEIMTKDFPNLAKGIKLQIQEAEANHKQDKPKELYIKFN